MKQHQPRKRAHERGVRVIGATLLPCRGAFFFTEEKDQIRLMANSWIRSGMAFDAVIDFEAIVRDTTDPSTLRTEFDSGDHLHPTHAAYHAMGHGIDLSLFER